MTSHAALVARGWGKCCIVGAGALDVDARGKRFTVAAPQSGDAASPAGTSESVTVKEGDWLTLNGTRGLVYPGQLPMVAGTEENPFFKTFMGICDKAKRLGVRANADTPDDARKASQFGAEGIGLFRTEHMFYGKGAEEPLFKLRKMIHSRTPSERKAALDELFPHIKTDIKATLEAMTGRPVTIRLLDPPLHEFVPKRPEERAKLAESLGISLDELASRADALHETNPMMGHRGVRLGVTYPEISETWLRAIFEAAAEIIRSGRKTSPEIMIPVTCDAKEITDQATLVKKVHDETAVKYRMKRIPHLVGTMIEIPRAALRAADMARVSDFFSYGTNDLTQMTYGFSRDDIGGFVPDYLAKGILPNDPFQVLDASGVGELIRMGIERGRSVRPELKVGICGEHGGEPSSVGFCHTVGMNYVSCSPYRVPIARLAAAQAAVRDRTARRPRKKKR
jgi:pyruvate,orthophosphate dikinase